MNNNFKQYLDSINLTPKNYLNEARNYADKHGYDAEGLTLNEDQKSEAKLIYEGEGFGRIGYKDYIIWRHLENTNQVPRGTAKKRRLAYLQRATNIRGSWRSNPISRNNLAIRILWDGEPSPL